MLIKIARAEAIQKFVHLPLRSYDAKNDQELFDYPKVFATYILTLPSTSNRGNSSLLGKQLVFLANNLSCDHFVFFGDIDIPWLGSGNNYKTPREAVQYLADNKVGKRFNGALQTGIAELPTFIKHFTRLVRTNGIVPYINFMDPEQQFFGSICQYGNLHLSTRTKKADKKIKAIMERSLFTDMTGTMCFNKFSKSSRIDQRTLVV